MEEVWKDIKEYEGLYQVSNTGEIKSLINNLIKKHKNDKDGYCLITLHCNGERKGYSIHRLVANAFIENLNNKPQLNHKDGNKRNNNVSNLEWCTAKENTHHAIKTGLMKNILSQPPRKVIQLGKDGNMISSYTSIKEAENKLGLSCGNICKVCKGINKTAGGFKWRYADE